MPKPMPSYQNNKKATEWTRHMKYAIAVSGVNKKKPIHMCLPGYTCVGVWVGMDENGIKKVTVKRFIRIIKQHWMQLCRTSVQSQNFLFERQLVQ